MTQLQSCQPSMYIDAAAVTPSDTNALPQPCRALYIGGSGSGALKVITLGGSTVAFAGLVAGVTLPLACQQVLATGTNVTNIVALY